MHLSRDIRATVIALVAFTLLLGLAYPLALTGIGQALFPNSADGRVVTKDGAAVGSRLIGQDGKNDPRWFQSRPSATEYSPSATFFNNLGPNSQDLADQIRAAAKAYLKANGAANPGLSTAKIPVDAVTTSASGVDPDISVANAEIQARRIAAARGLPVDRVLRLVDDHTAGRALGFLGEPVVHVLDLNLALDREDPR